MILLLVHPAPLNDLYRERATIPWLRRVADFRDGNGRPVTLFEVAW